MQYTEILEQIAKKQGVTKEEVEKEMLFALKSADLNCSVKDFLSATKETLQKTIYSNIV